MKLLFVGLPRDIPNLLRRGRFSDLRAPRSERIPDNPNITVVRPVKLLPNSMRISRIFNEWLYRVQVRWKARRIGMHSPLLWLNPHYAVHFVGQMGERAVIYDITDDWTSLTQSPALATLTARQDEELCRLADAVIVCSERLLEMKRGLARQIYLIPNGVDAEHYRAVLDEQGPLPAETAAWSKPVLGYTGTIHPDRVDVPLVEELARRMTAVTIALVGPIMLPPEDLERLAHQKNIVLTGPVPYARLPQIMRAFDVCITPHRVSPFTESLNPIKLYEYLAAGIPIVSTDVAGFRDYPALVRIATGAEEFQQAVELALIEDSALTEERYKVAREHSWESRLDAVETVIGACVESTGKS